MHKLKKKPLIQYSTTNMGYRPITRGTDPSERNWYATLMYIQYWPQGHHIETKMCVCIHTYACTDTYVCSFSNLKAHFHFGDIKT